MNKKITKIKNGKFITPTGILENVFLYFSDEKIVFVTSENLPFESEIDAQGGYVASGFIDTHVHGGGGHDFMDGGIDPIVAAADFHLKHGTTTILPTTLCCSHDTLKSFLEDIKTVMENKLCKSNVAGVHLEGPYFSKSQCGAQNPDYIKNPNTAEYEEIIAKFGKIIKKWSFAPELSGSEEFCNTHVKNGIVASFGHSDATYEDVKGCYIKGCRHFTHLYSGMSAITRHNGYRKLGVIESAYCFGDVFVEVIADGKHLPAELLKMIVDLKGTDNVCLVTDAMRAAGESVGESFLGRKGEEVPCIIEDRVAKLPDRKSFAGSVATADVLVKTLVRECGTDVFDAVKMITEVPAKICGLHTKGRLKENFDADIIIFDEDINIKNVIVGGKECIKNGNQNL